MIFKTFTVLIVFFIVNTNIITRSSTEVFIGGLFDGPIINNEIAFNVAIDRINEEDILPSYTLKPLSVHIEHDNVIDVGQRYTTEITWNKPYTVLKSACSMLNTGISTIFTHLSEDNSDAIQSLCDVKEIPLVQTTINDKHERECCCSINLYPHMSVLVTAYADLIRKRNWKSFTIIYEEEESITGISELLKIYNTSTGSVVLRQLHSKNNDANYINGLKDIRKSGQVNFVLICKIESLHEIFSQAQRVGLMTNGYNYIVVNLDMHTIDLSAFQHSNTNITGFRLINPSNPDAIEFAGALQNRRREIGLEMESVSPYIAAWKLQTSTALIMDGIRMFSEVLKDVGEFAAKPLFCNTSEDWEHGTTFYNFMKMKSINGLSGRVELNQKGVRTNFMLDIIELTEGGIIEMGSWSSAKGITDAREPEADEFSMQNKTYNVAICLTEPYAMLKDIPQRLIGNDQYEGFAVDLIAEMARYEGFNYTFILCYDGKNGIYDENTGTWSGMIANVLDGSADFAISDLTINRERGTFVDFTSPFMSLGVQILYKKPTQSAPDFFSFAAPLAWEVWFLTGITFFGMAFMFFVTGRLCPAEWYNPYPCFERPPHLVNQYSFNNCLWLTVGNLMQEGTEVAPRGASTRILASFWSFFILIMVSCYTANMAAFLTTENELWPFTDYAELVNRADKLGISYGAVYKGATHRFFEESSFYSEIGDYMKSHRDAMVSNNAEGTEWVSDKNYAFFMESTSINYIVERECNLTAVGDFLDERFYAIAVSKNSSYRNRLSASILHLTENGVIDELERKWWKRERGGGECMKSSGSADTPPLNYKHVVGIFWITLVGCVLACVWVVVEMGWGIVTKYKDKQRRIEELKKELRFYCKFEGMIKPVKSDETQEQSLLYNSGISK